MYTSSKHRATSAFFGVMFLATLWLNTTLCSPASLQLYLSAILR